MLRCGLLALLSSALLLGIQTHSWGQTRTDRVCWANPDCTAGCGAQFQSKIYSCGSGGHSGFNPDWVCQQTCGANEGPHCRMTAGPGGDCGTCGFRAATIDCF